MICCSCLFLFFCVFDSLVYRDLFPAATTKIYAPKKSGPPFFFLPIVPSFLNFVPSFFFFYLWNHNNTVIRQQKEKQKKINILQKARQVFFFELLLYTYIRKSIMVSFSCEVRLI